MRGLQKRRTTNVLTRICDWFVRLMPSLVQALGGLLLAWGLFELSHWLGLAVGGLVAILAGIAMEARRDGAGVMDGPTESD
jgi:hypothetical protein